MEIWVLAIREILFCYFVNLLRILLKFAITLNCFVPIWILFLNDEDLHPNSSRNLRGTNRNKNCGQCLHQHDVLSVFVMILSPYEKKLAHKLTFAVRDLWYQRSLKITQKSTKSTATAVRQVFLEEIVLQNMLTLRRKTRRIFALQLHPQHQHFFNKFVFSQVLKEWILLISENRVESEYQSRHVTMYLQINRWEGWICSSDPFSAEVKWTVLRKYKKIDLSKHHEINV